MGYSQKQKRDTHATLLKLASAMLRESGPEKLGVVELMRAAGLTHGGFYAHFESKEALLLETLKVVFEEAQQKYHLIGDGLPPREALTNVIDEYVSSGHRDRLSMCPIVTLNSDLLRQSKRFRATFSVGVKKLVRILANWIEAAGLRDSEALAASILSAMAGAIAVSRAVSDKHLSDNVLAMARSTIKVRLGLNDAIPGYS
jgi:TetR/AcrR family transcriptional regulator, transcriptional repressor for nem operon